jgi:hypothetical protein
MTQHRIYRIRNDDFYANQKRGLQEGEFKIMIFTKCIEIIPLILAEYNQFRWNSVSFITIRSALNLVGGKPYKFY